MPKAGCHLRYLLLLPVAAIGAAGLPLPLERGDQEPGIEAAEEGLSAHHHRLLVPARACAGSGCGGLRAGREH